MWLFAQDQYSHPLETSEFSLPQPPQTMTNYAECHGACETFHRGYLISHIGEDGM